MKCTEAVYLCRFISAVCLCGVWLRGAFRCTSETVKSTSVCTAKDVCTGRNVMVRSSAPELWHPLCRLPCRIINNAVFSRLMNKCCDICLYEELQLHVHPSVFRELQFSLHANLLLCSGAGDEWTVSVRSGFCIFGDEVSRQGFLEKNQTHRQRRMLALQDVRLFIDGHDAGDCLSALCRNSNTLLFWWIWWNEAKRWDEARRRNSALDLWGV